MTASDFRATADTFTKAYLEAALWSSSAELGRCYTCNDEKVTVDPQTERCATCGSKVSGTDRSFQDLCFDADDIAPETLDKIVADCAKFQAEQGELITEENCERLPGECTVTELAGHDFWLTRNGHGAGFWDGDWREPAATRLDDASKAFGEVNLYLGGDGTVNA